MASGASGNSNAGWGNIANMWGNAGNAQPAQAGFSGGNTATAAPTTGMVPATPTNPVPTSNDAMMGPSYMPAQPNMAGAPVAAAPPPAPKPAAPAVKKPAATTPAQNTGIDPKLQQQAQDIMMRGSVLGGGSYGYNAANSKAFADQQRQMLALAANANPATKAMIQSLNQNMVANFNRRRSGNQQGGSR